MLDRLRPVLLHASLIVHRKTPSLSAILGVDAARKFSAIACSNEASRTQSFGSHAMSCINDELLKQFDLSPCVLLGPPRTLASPLRPIAHARVRPGRFGVCRPSRAAPQGWW